MGCGPSSAAGEVTAVQKPSDISAETKTAAPIQTAQATAAIAPDPPAAASPTVAAAGFVSRPEEQRVPTPERSPTPDTAARSVTFSRQPTPSTGASSPEGAPAPANGANGVSAPPPGAAANQLQPRARTISKSALRQTSKPPMRQASTPLLSGSAASSRTARLAQRRMIPGSFSSLQASLPQDAENIPVVSTRAAGLKHIGFGPLKRENQDDFFIQVGDFGGLEGSNLFCVFDGHGSHGKGAASTSRQHLPVLLDTELRKFLERGASSDGYRGAVEVLITEVFAETERAVVHAGVDLSSSGTTCSVAYQQGNRVWVASAGDSRVILCCRTPVGWRPQALTIDHRPRRPSERARVEAAGARVAPKRLPSGRTVGEPRMWLQEVHSPGLLLSRSLGDLKAATVGCTSDPETTFTTLRPHQDCFLVMATDGVWDVLSNEQVCDIVVASPDPHTACRRVLDAALYEWEEKLSADNVTVLVIEFEWGLDPNDSGVLGSDHVLALNPMGSSDVLSSSSITLPLASGDSRQSSLQSSLSSATPPLSGGGGAGAAQDGAGAPRATGSVTSRPSMDGRVSQPAPWQRGGTAHSARPGAQPTANGVHGAPPNTRAPSSTPPVPL